MDQDLVSDSICHHHVILSKGIHLSRLHSPINKVGELPSVGSKNKALEMDRWMCSYWFVLLAMQSSVTNLLTMASPSLSMKQMISELKGWLNKIMGADFLRHCTHSVLRVNIIGILLPFSKVAWPLMHTWLFSCCSLYLECVFHDSFLVIYFCIFCKTFSGHSPLFWTESDTFHSLFSEDFVHGFLVGHFTFRYTSYALFQTVSCWRTAFFKIIFFSTRYNA